MADRPIKSLSQRRMHKAEMIVFSRAGQVYRVRLPRDHSFVIFGREEKPFAFTPEGGPGTYEIDVSMLPGGTEMSLPIAIAVVPTKHVKAVEALRADVVDRMLNAIDAHTAGTRQ